MSSRPTPVVAGVLAVLDRALATELICLLRCKQHHFAAAGLGADKVAADFAEQALQCLGQADAIATRIVQLGGQPDLCPDRFSARSLMAYAERNSVGDMLRENLSADRIRLDGYRELLRKLGDADPVSRRLLEDRLREDIPASGRS